MPQPGGLQLAHNQVFLTADKMKLFLQLTANDRIDTPAVSSAGM